MPSKGTKKTHITPVKFNAFFDEFEKILNENSIVHTPEGEREIPNNNALIFTDAELLTLTNERLEEKDRIEHTTFEKWKKAFFDGKLSPEIETRFFGVYKRAILKSKESLFNALILSGNNWQRFAWILERKFSETWGKKDKEEQKETPQKIEIVKTYKKLK